MIKKSLLIIIPLLIISCSKKPDVNLTEIKPLPGKIGTVLKPVSKNFKISDKGIKIKADYGMTISVPEQAFVNSKGVPVKDNITLSVQQAMDSMTITATGIPMVVNKNGEISRFESAAMFNIEASAGNEKLSLAPGKKITVSLPLDKLDEGFKVYSFDRNGWNEVPVEIKKDDKIKLEVTEIEEYTGRKTKGAIVFRDKMFMYVFNNQGLNKIKVNEIKSIKLINETTEIDNTKIKEIESTTKAKISDFKKYQTISSSMESSLEISYLGWWNIDKPYPLPTLTGICGTFIPIDKKDEILYTGYVIGISTRQSMPVLFENNSIKSQAIPGSKVRILLIDTATNIGISEIFTAGSNLFNINEPESSSNKCNKIPAIVMKKYPDEIINSREKLMKMVLGKN